MRRNDAKKMRVCTLGVFYYQSVRQKISDLETYDNDNYTINRRR